jgi:hypothetical protein
MGSEGTRHRGSSQCARTLWVGTRLGIVHQYILPGTSRAAQWTAQRIGCARRMQQRGRSCGGCKRQCVRKREAVLLEHPLAHADAAGAFTSRCRQSRRTGQASGWSDRDRVGADPPTAGGHFPAGRLVRAGRAGAAGASHRRCACDVAAADVPIARARPVEQVCNGRADKLVHGPVPLRHIRQLRVIAELRSLQRRLGTADGDALEALACASTSCIPPFPLR